MNWIDQFYGLSRLSGGIRDILLRQSKIVDLPTGTVVFGPAKTPLDLLLLIKGTVRVSQTTENGREIVLYRVHAGESCVMTNACLFTFEENGAEGITESDVTAAAIPKSVFDRLVAESSEFREFVFAAYSRRITDLMYVVEEVAFGRIDIRLAQRLLHLVNSMGDVKGTHQDFATELGSAREVISRQLQDFQKRGLVKLNRGSLHVTDLQALTTLAQSS
ncbi:Crp/Fnr family transcriptional regulator [Cochlodiniinecator piscidefendens]|uniref:Crp/Fnr family transcriptional regulator n=1 Tax=Cochlodiniinecator piscidefendens TaxID=2715756 RepID=UPI00140A66E5|nr:Crp/Fnr family transcriptional regulator [Cochlodiniinecator piscidefendens]